MSKYKSHAVASVIMCILVAGSWRAAAAQAQVTPPRCALNGEQFVSVHNVALHETVSIVTLLQTPCVMRQVAIAFGLRTGPYSGFEELWVREEVADWLRTVDLSDAAVALVANGPGRTLHSLSQDRESLLESVFIGMNRPPPADAVQALQAARLELTMGEVEGLRDQAILLLADSLYGGHGGPAAREANMSKARGTEIFVVGSRNTGSTGVRSLASSPRHFFELPPVTTPSGSLRQSYQAITPKALRAVEATFRRHAFEIVTITSTVPATFTYVPGSAVPPANWDPATRELTWTLADPPVTTTLEFDVRPLVCGTSALPEWSRAWGRDRSGTEYRHTFEPSDVTVPCPTSTPTATVPIPTNTPAPTLTREPTATLVAVPVFLPIALSEDACSQVRRAAVALAIDTSSSMLELTALGRTKLEAATTAAAAFVDLLVFPQDQAAVIGFDSVVHVAQTLTDDPEEVREGLARLSASPGTDIAAGVLAAHAELTSPRRRPGNLAVLILMTDGRAQDGPALSLSAAAAAKADGIALFTIGLGTDVDRATLQSMASTPRWYYEAAKAEDLAELYRSVAVDLPCPADRYWGRR